MVCHLQIDADPDPAYHVDAVPDPDRDPQYWPQTDTVLLERTKNTDGDSLSLWLSWNYLFPMWLSWNYLYPSLRRRIEEQVAKRVEEELERRRDEIEAEVRHTVSLPLYLSLPIHITRTKKKLRIFKPLISVKCVTKHTYWQRFGYGSAFVFPHWVCGSVSGSRGAKMTHRNRKT